MQIIRNWRISLTCLPEENICQQSNLLTFQIFRMAQVIDLRSIEPTDENLRMIMGHNDVRISQAERQKQCSNCGEFGHEWNQCKLPTMDQLIELYEQYAFDPTNSAVEEKQRITKDIYEKANN